MKKSVELNGRIVFPLTEGRCAYITCSSGIIKTSKVVNVITVTEEKAHFETMNSFYKVTFEKSPSEAANSLSLCA